MKPANYLILGTALSLLVAAPAVSRAQSAPAGQILDPATVAWPRTFTADGNDMAIFQPQISTWKGNQLAGRFAVGVRLTGSKEEAYGVVSFTARTEIDKLNRLVTLEDLELGKVNFPTQSGKEVEYLALLKKHLPEKAKTIPLDHLESVFVLSGEVEKQAEVAVKNDPPRIVYTTQPAVLVLVDGPPVLKPLDQVYDRVINTRAVLLLNKLNSKYYCYAARRWYNAHSIEGPFKFDPDPPADIRPALRLALATKKVDPMLPAGEGTPPCGLYTSMTAAELIQTTGIANVTPVQGTANLLYVTNTDNALFLDVADSNYYALLSGRWFCSTSLNGPWSFVPSGSLPADFQKIPADHPKSNVLASVHGTPQAHEAVIASSTDGHGGSQQGQARGEL